MLRVSNLRQVVTVVAEPDPVGTARVVGLGRAIWSRVQGAGASGVYDLARAPGSPETTYGGSYAGPVQGTITGGVAKVGTSSITKDTISADISSGLTDANAGAARIFAERLRRGGRL